MSWSGCGKRSGRIASIMVMLVPLSGCQIPNGMLRQRALEALQTQQIEKAEAYLTKAIQKNPADGRAQLYLARIYLVTDRPLDGQLALEQSLIQLHDTPQTPEALDLLAESLYRQKRKTKLFTLLQQAADERGGVHDYLRQGEYLNRVGDKDNALIAYRKATYFAGSQVAEPYLKLASFFETVGDRSNALKALRQAYGINPDEPGLSDRLRGYGMVPGPSAALPADGGEWTTDEG